MSKPQRITVTSKDERMIKIQTPLDVEDLNQLGRELSSSAAEGYSVSHVNYMSGGTQRDPTIIGVIFYLRRTP